MRQRVVVNAPASSANMGPGFDVFAICLKAPGDTLALRRTAGGVSLTLKGPGNVPEAPAQNVASVVAEAIMSEHEVEEGVSMTLRKGVPVGAGLGSSAASSVAAAVGTSLLFGLELSPAEIIRYAGMGEKHASGTAHYDNVTASYAGGFVIAGDDFGYVKIEAPRSLALCLVTPEVNLPEKKTKYARSLLPREVSLERMVDVTRAASLMVHGFATGDVEEIGRAMAVSPVDEARAKMIPRFEDVRKSAIAHGATGVCISGAGPTVLAVSDRRRSQDVVKEMVGAFRSGGIESSGFTTRVGDGCSVAKR